MMPSLTWKISLSTSPPPPPLPLSDGQAGGKEGSLRLLLLIYEIHSLPASIADNENYWREGRVTAIVLTMQDPRGTPGQR
jgi:hypothetical protein